MKIKFKPRIKLNHNTFAWEINVRITHPVQPLNLSVAASICWLWNTFLKVARPSFQSLLNVQYSMQLKVHMALSITSYYAINSFWISSVSECSLYQQSRSHMVHLPSCLLLLSSFILLIPYSTRQPACSQASERPTSYTSLHHYQWLRIISCYTTLLVRVSAKKQWQFVAFIHQSRSDKLYNIIVKLLF